MLFGVVVMLLAMTICIVLIQTFVIQQNAQSAQTAADSIADATAVYAANEGANYSEACIHAKKVQEMVKDKTHTDTKDLEMDPELYEKEGQVGISLGFYDKYYVSDKSGAKARNYRIGSTSVTEFGSNSELVRAAQSKLGCLYSWGATGENYFDCSGLVSWCYWKCGARHVRRTTYSIVTDFPAYKVGKNELRAGDIIICNGGAHVVIYMGDGNIIGANGGGSATHGDNPNACVKIQPLSHYDSGYVQAYRIPIAAW